MWLSIAKHIYNDYFIFPWSWRILAVIINTSIDNGSRWRILFAKDSAFLVVYYVNEYAYTNFVYIYLSNLFKQLAFYKFYIPLLILFLLICNTPKFMNADGLWYLRHLRYVFSASSYYPCNYRFFANDNKIIYFKSLCLNVLYNFVNILYADL